ncbi:MAG: MMPL family transporter [Pirellulaceae bacterium]
MSAFLPFLVFAVAKIQTNTAAVEQWLPANGEQRIQYSEFVNRFGEDLFLAVSWNGCDLNDPRLGLFAEHLRLKAIQDHQLAIRKIVSTTDLVEQLTSDPCNLSFRDAVRRLQGVFIGPKQTCVVLILLSGNTSDQQTRVLEAVLDSAKASIGLSRDELRLGGSAYEAVFIDESSERSVKYFVLPSACASLLVAYFCVGQLRLSFAIMFLAGYCQMCGVALIYYFGEQLNAVLTVFPSMLFMLTVSALLHLVNYYREAESAGKPNAVSDAFHNGWLPCAMASFTTSIGFASLMVSNLKPIRDFGFFSSIGLMLSTGVLLVSFPWVVKTFSRPIETTQTVTTASKIQRFITQQF